METRKNQMPSYQKFSELYNLVFPGMWSLLKQNLCLKREKWYMTKKCLNMSFGHQVHALIGLCQTLIQSRDYHSLMFWFSLAELCCSTPVTAKDERLFDVLVKDAKDTKRERQKGLLSFLDPSSLRLASSSPLPPNCLGLKKPTHLGELQLA